MGEAAQEAGIVFLIIFGVIIGGFIVGALIKKCCDDHKREKYRVNEAKEENDVSSNRSQSYDQKSPQYEVGVDNGVPRPGEEDEEFPRPPRHGREERKDEGQDMTQVQSLGLSFDADQ
jgi:hypothetical protein